MFTMELISIAKSGIQWMGGPPPEPVRLSVSNPSLHASLAGICQENGRRLAAGLPTLQKMPAVSATSVGRNDPCPCGSGRKYKKCCLQ